MRDLKRVVLILGLCAAGVFAANTTPVRADDMMQACEAEISRYCADVTRGRGRIFACLFARGNRLGAECSEEVKQVAAGASGYVSADVMALPDTAQGRELLRQCESDYNARCSSVASGEGRPFACLYAYENRLSRPCKQAADDVR